MNLSPSPLSELMDGGYGVMVAIWTTVGRGLFYWQIIVGQRAGSATTPHAVRESYQWEVSRKRLFVACISVYSSRECIVD